MIIGQVALNKDFFTTPQSGGRIPVGTELVPMTLCGCEALGDPAYGRSWMARAHHSGMERKLGCFGEQSVPTAGVRKFMTHLRKS